MKHRTHKDFPSYRFYSDGRIMNKPTNHFIKVKRHMKLIDAKGKRRSITVQKYFAQLFPNLYTWEDLRGKPTYTPIKVSDILRLVIGNVGNIILSSLRLFSKRQIIKLGMNYVRPIIYRWVV